MNNEQNVTDPFPHCYSDDNKRKTFSNSSNNGHWLKIYCMCKQTFSNILVQNSSSISMVTILFS